MSQDQQWPATPQIAQGPRLPPTRRIVHLLCLLVAAIVFIDAVVGDGGVVVRQRRRQEYDRLASELDRLKSANDLMREQNRRLRDDPDALEEAARRDLGLMRRGETVFIIKDHRDHSERSDHPPAPAP